MNKHLLTITIFAFSILSVVLITKALEQTPDYKNQTSEETKQEDPSLKQYVANKEDRISKESYKAVLDGCTGGIKSKESYCKCTIDYLDENYTNDEIVEMSNTIAGSNNIPRAIVDAANNCVHLLK